MSGKLPNLSLFLSSLASLAMAAPAMAGECLYHSADWSADDAPDPAPDDLRELRLVYIDVDETALLLSIWFPKS